MENKLIRNKLFGALPIELHQHTPMTGFEPATTQPRIDNLLQFGSPIADNGA